MEKKTYASPSLEVHGDVEDITRDGGTMPEMNPFTVEQEENLVFST